MTPERDNTMQPIAWLGMHLTVPGDWEILRHSTRPQRGQLTFADERRGRLYLAWAAAERAPDIRRWLSDHRARQLEQDPASRFEDLPHPGAFAGYRWLSGGHWLTRAGRHDGIHRRWIELTIPWPGGLKGGLERKILESFRLVDERDGPAQWCAFGLDVRCPGRWEVREARVQPGAVTLRLAGEQAEATVRRYRATDGWYDGDAEALIRKDLAGRCCRVDSIAYRGGQALLARSRQPGHGWRKMLGRKRERADLVWENAKAHSLYHVTLVRDGGQEPDPAIVQVTDLFGEASS